MAAADWAADDGRGARTGPTAVSAGRVTEPHYAPPQRISIQGISGSGKTRLGRVLEREMGIPHLETDELVHGPGLERDARPPNFAPWSSRSC